MITLRSNYNLNWILKSKALHKTQRMIQMDFLNTSQYNIDIHQYCIENLKPNPFDKIRTIMQLELKQVFEWQLGLRFRGYIKNKRIKCTLCSDITITQDHIL